MKEAVQRHYKSLEIEERPIDIKKKKKQIRQGVINENVCGMYDIRGFSISEDKKAVGCDFCPRRFHSTCVRATI